MANLMRRYNPESVSLWDLFNPEYFHQNYKEAESEWGELRVPADLYSDKDWYYLTFDVPGFDKKDISIQWENGYLTVSGNRQFQWDEKKQGYVYRERSFGSFSRTFSLPESASEKNITAKVKDGVLYITVPKSAKASSKKIKVE